MGNWTIKAVGCNDTEWIGLLSRSEHLLFHEPAWAAVLKDGLNGSPCCLLIQKGGQTVGGLIGFVRKIAGLRMMFMTVPYGGVLGDAPPGSEFMRLLTGFASERGIARIRIVDPPGVSRTPRDGFEVIQGNSHILPLEGKLYETIWMGYKKNIRRDVRIAERHGVTLSVVTDKNGLNDFYDLYLESMVRNRAVPKYGREFVNAFFKHVAALGRGAILLAVKDGAPIAGALVADSEKTSHYLMAGSRTAFLSLCPNDFLIHSAIRRASEKKFQYFDFMGSDGTDPNLEHFKAKWGAEPVEVITLTLVIRPLLYRLWGYAYKLAQTPIGLKLLNWSRRRA